MLYFLTEIQEKEYLAVSGFQIISDSTTDLSPALVKEMGVHIIPMMFSLQGKDYQNDPEESQLSSHDFYEILRSGAISTTSQINSETFKDHAKPFLEAGKDVLYIAFSSGLSGTYNSARLAAEDLAEAYPQRKIIVVDSLAASMGEGLLVYLAVQQQKQGADIDAVAAWVEENKAHLAHWFTVDDLNHLHRGGRVSGTAAFVGTMLGIKPVLHVDDEGHLIPMEKVRGRKQSLDALVDHMEKTALHPAQQTVFISHGDCAADCAYVEQQVKERLGVQTVYTNPIGPVIGTHSGPGTIALFFLAENKD